MDFRIGHGYDAHRLVEGRELILCGVKIPFEKGLLGHSDADVATHALIDALLGAAAAGDIGRLFPDSDPSFKDADSIELLKKALSNAAFSNYEVSNVDLTVVAQRPKLAPYVQSMRERLAVAMEIPPERVSVKAKTTEGMGFCGTGEGVESFAVVLLEKHS